MPPSKKAPDAAARGRSARSPWPGADAEFDDEPPRPARAATARAGRLAEHVDAPARELLYADPRAVRIPKYPESSGEPPAAKPRAVRTPKYPEPSEESPAAKSRAARTPKYPESSGELPAAKPRAVRLVKQTDPPPSEPSRTARRNQAASAPSYLDASDEEGDRPTGPRRATLLKEGRAYGRAPANESPMSSAGARARKSAATVRVTAAARAGSDPLGAPARPARKRATPAKPSRTGRRGALVPTEAGLLWGLLYDLVCAPIWLIGLVLGRGKLGDGLRPLDRLLQFALSARMTALLITLNLLVFAVEIYTRHAGWSRAAFVAHFALSTDGLARGEHLPLLTHFFAHASLMHLGGNMLALFVFGRVVERNLGPWRLLSCYLLAAVCSTALSLLSQGLTGRSVPTLGASGAVAGLVALGILLEPLTITFEALLPMPLFLVGWLAMATDFAALLGPGGAADPVDHPAHLGGYLSVLLGYYALKRQHQEQARLGLLINLATLLLMAGMWLFWGSRGG